MFIILIILLLFSTPAFGNSISPDGKWFGHSAIISDINPIIGLDANDIKIHKYHTYLYIQDKLVSEEIIHTNSLRKMLTYKKPMTIQPSFSYIKYIIYVDGKAILAYDFHTNATGLITFYTMRWIME